MAYVFCVWRLHANFCCCRRYQRESSEMKICKINGYKWKKYDELLIRSKRIKTPQLQEILHKKLIKMITLTCRDGFDQLPNFERSKLELRNYLSQLPATVRTSLLDEILGRRMWKHRDETYPRKLYYSEVLFSKGVSKLHFRSLLNIEICHLNSLLKLLSEEGNNLQVLILYDFEEYKPLDENLLAKALFTAAKLSTLSLPEFCNDSALKLIGENCKRLQKLVLRYTSVSHKGFTFLTQNIVKRDVKQDCLSEDWNSALWPFPNIFLPLQELIPRGGSVEWYTRQKSPLCDTLKVLEMEIYTMDKDKFRGLLMVLELVPDLEEFKHVDLKDFFQMLGKKLIEDKMKNIQLPTFNLARIFTWTMGDQIHDLMRRMCPNLRFLRYHGFTGGDTSLVPISKLNSFTMLDTLESYDTPYLSKDIAKLAPEIRERLTVLQLGNELSGIPFNLHDVLQLPCLQNLTLFYNSFMWESQDDKYSKTYHFNLDDVTLGGKVSQKSLIKLLECAPNLEKLWIDSIDDRTADFVKRLCNIRKSPKLKVLMMSEEYLLQKKEELVMLLTCYTKLKKLKRIPLTLN